MGIYNIIDKINNNDSESFHIFSEKYFRGQILKYNSGKILSSYKLKDENLLIIVLKGNIKLSNDQNVNIKLRENMQILLKENETFSIEVIEKCILEYIWSPGLYKT